MYIDTHTFNLQVGESIRCKTSKWSYANNPSDRYFINGFRIGNKIGFDIQMDSGVSTVV